MPPLWQYFLWLRKETSSLSTSPVSSPRPGGSRRGKERASQPCANPHSSNAVPAVGGSPNALLVWSRRGLRFVYSRDNEELREKRRVHRSSSASRTSSAWSRSSWSRVTASGVIERVVACKA